MSTNCRLAVIVLTYNEELHLERALSSVEEIATEIFVIDSFSTDRTPSIAASRKATLLQRKFVNQADQFQWALDNAPISADWVMRLDADEVLEPALVEEIARKLPNLPPGVSGVRLKRKHIFMGRWIKHGGRYPVLLLRLWRRGAARVEQRWMDEHMLLLHGRAVTFSNTFADVNLNNLNYFIEKHNNYATREAIEILNQRYDLFPPDLGLITSPGRAQAGVKRWIKDQIYNRLPFEFGAILYFFLRYVVQLGFLDGREGAIYHMLQGFWYRYLVGAKVMELERSLEGLSSSAALVRISQLTGLKID